MSATSSNIVFAFSGQGSHYRKMGEELYRSHSAFRQSLESSDQLVYRNTGRSLIEELYEQGNEVFDDLLVTHPAIVAVEVAMIAVMQDAGIRPQGVMGVSLGEFAAGVAAGIWFAEEAILTSIEQAKTIIQNVAEGGISVVIGPKDDEILNVLNANELSHGSVNFEGCYIVSGGKKALDEFDHFMSLKAAVYQRLEVLYPFHSPLMQSGKICWPPLGLEVETSKPAVPYYSAMLRDRLEVSFTDDFLWDVTMVDFDVRDTVNKIEDEIATPCYLDLGPSGTTANFIKYILGARADGSSQLQSSFHSFLSPFHNGDQKLSEFLKETHTQHYFMERIDQ